MDAIGLYNSHRAFQRHVAPLIDAALVEMTDPGKPNARSQKYALTGKGAATRASSQ
jgi:hypothetical protein